MNIGGLQKTSLLDYPDSISAIIWTVDCNFRCPFCYNKNLVFKKADLFSEQEILEMLKNRKKMLDAVVISGGEPLLQKDIEKFLIKVKKIGYLTKIDTNGTFPKKLQKLIDEKLVDYISMDVKAPKEKYDKLAGVKVDISKIKKSIEIIKNSNCDYEFKTTFAPDLLKKEDILKIGKWLDGAEKFYLQQFKANTPLISSKMEKSTPYSKEYFLETLEEIKPFFKECVVRGI
jgi:pyruvate formate lyase activating enzyme